MVGSDGVSRLGLHFCESRSWSRRFQVSSRSGRFQVSRLWILQRNFLLKFLSFNDFLFVVFAGKKQPKHVGKMPEIWKKLKSEVMTTLFNKISAKCTNFEVSVSNFKSRVLVSDFLIKSRSRLEFLTRSRSRNFYQVSVSVSKVTVSTTSLMVGYNSDELNRGIRSMTVQAIL